MTLEQTALRIIDLNDPRQVAEVKEFLVEFQLDFSPEVEYTIALHRDQRLIGTGSLAGNVLRNIAVSPDCRGEGLTATIVSRLIEELGRRGRFHYFVYTRPEKTCYFRELGLAEIARAEPYVSLLEGGLGSIARHCRELNRLVSHLPAGPRAGIVLNANPFTLGHRQLVRQAAAENGSVVVFVVSEDRSLFSYKGRFDLVRENLADLPNVAVLPTGEYLISQATFPAYFLSGDAAAVAQTRLDATVFALHIGPAAQITARYVGEEPVSVVTALYNDALAEILPAHGIKLRVMQRLKAGEEIISASAVREALGRGDWQHVRRLVPESTYRFLVSRAAEPIIKQIKRNNGRP